MSKTILLVACNILGHKTDEVDCVVVLLLFYLKLQSVACHFAEFLIASPLKEIHVSSTLQMKELDCKHSHGISSCDTYDLLKPLLAMFIIKVKNSSLLLFFCHWSQVDIVQASYR